MSIYGDFLSNFSSENKRWKADLKNKTLICEDKKYIEAVEERIERIVLSLKKQNCLRDSSFLNSRT